MMEEYIKFTDEDKILGIWFVGNASDHFWCVASEKDGQAVLDFKATSERVLAGKESAMAACIKGLNETPLPLTELGKTDKEIHLAIHDMLYIIVPSFIPTDPAKGGGIIVLGPCSGKDAKAILNDPKQVDWSRMFPATKGSC